MSIRQLTKEEFLATFKEPMRRLTAGETYRSIPLKDYVSECIDSLRLKTTVADIEIRNVYLSGDQRYTHVLLYYGESNRYLVVVVNHETDSVEGHHLLDLNREYGLMPA